MDVLRGTLVRSLVSIVICCIPAVCLPGLLFDGIVLRPTKPDFWIYRLLGWNLDMNLINVEVSAQFFVHLRCAIVAGLVIAFPYVVFELWRFISPALYDSEKRAVRKAFGFSGFLFYAGVLTGYFLVLPACLQFFLNYSVSDSISNAITIGSYISLFASLVLLTGIAFEFPAIILMLSSLGVVTRKMLRKSRAYAFLVILIISAVITPADPVSMFVLALPLYLLYELSILLCRE
ncbi:MAG: twin-arginine translocase subunit TatC [Bacteroidales bacterium]|nr:twin-arginine translocase subunit TatC [Bacteroidales bacterium]